jgi:succinate dehydrogenase / fumarate reductase cytochrome b subunit
MPARARPTSPHWTHYRWQIGSSLSILHRATGTLLALGLIVLAFWWMALASGPAAFSRVARVLGSPIGMLLLFGISFSFWYHTLNGVRHLFLDTGRGFEKAERHGSGWAAVVGAVLLTAGLWVMILRHLSS